MRRSGKRGKLGCIRLTKSALTNLRLDCFIRDHWRCVACGSPVTWVTGEMAHIVSRGAGGSDELSNVRTKCHRCHGAEHNPKAVPKPL